MTPCEAYIRVTYQTEGTRPTLVRASRNDLPSLFARLGFVKGVEVGTWTGKYATRLCGGVPNLHLTCIDPWLQIPGYLEVKNDQARMDAAYADAQRRLASRNCELWRMTSLDGAARVPDRSLDFVYIDANHLEPFVLEDLRAWVPKVRSGGIVAGHDYVIGKIAKPFIQVQAAVDRFTTDHQIDPWFVFTNDKSPSFLWMVR